MKPDGVATAALEPMDALDSNLVNAEEEAATAPPPAAVELAQQAASPLEEEQGGGVKPQPAAAKAPPADPKAKPPLKAKAGSVPAKTVGGPRPNAAPGRVTNGVPKHPQTNGVAKKSSVTGAPDKKAPPASMKPPGLAAAPSSKAPAKAGEKRPAAANRPPSGPATNGVNATTATAVTKKPLSAPAKKPAAPKPVTGAPTKPSVGSPKPDRPPVSKTTRPTGTAASRPASASTRAPAAKISTPTAKPAALKTPSTTPRPAASKTPSTTPSAARTPASQASKTTTPVKKDVAKPTTPALKKAAPSPLTRPSPSAKSTKPETPKSTSKPDNTTTATKKPVLNKAADTKTTARPKTQENKPTPSKTQSSKTAATKSSSPKKTVGSSTPTPVKRASKPASLAPPPAHKQSEEKEAAAATVAAVAAAVTAAVTAATIFSGPEDPGEVSPIQDTELLSIQTEEVSALFPEPVPEPNVELISELTPAPETLREPSPEPIREPSPELLREPSPEPIREPSPELLREPSPEPIREPSPELLREPSPEPIREPSPELLREPSPEPIREPSPELLREPSPEPISEPSPELLREPSPEPLREPRPELLREPSPEPLREPSPELLREPSPESIRKHSPKHIREPSPEPIREPSPELLREPSPEPLREPSPKHIREPSPEPIREPSPELLREPSPEPLREPSSATFRQPTPEAVREPTPEPEELFSGSRLEGEPLEQASFSIPPLSASLAHLGMPACDSVPCLGTTVMSPPCSPPGAMSPARELQSASPMQEMHVQPDPWAHNQALVPSDMAPDRPLKEETRFHIEEEEEDDDDDDDDEVHIHEEDEEQEEEEENLFIPTSAAPPADAFLMEASPMDRPISGSLPSPQEKEEAVEKAEEELNDDDEDEDDEDEEDEEQRRLGHHPLSALADASGSHASSDLPASCWHGDDPLSGMDSEDVSSSGSSRLPGLSDLSSTQHMALLEGTQSSDALVDSREGEGNFMGSPNVETLANEEDDDEDEEERVDDMDLSSERAEERRKAFPQQGANNQEVEDEEEDEDVEMPSEGVTESGLESCENADEDYFNEEERLDNLNRGELPPPAWGGQGANFFSDPWAQPASSPSPVLETPTQSPGAPCLALQEAELLPATVSPARPASETSTPDELRDYDSSSGVESRSDKQHTPVPALVDTDLDLGIHLEKGEEEEEAETLPADEVLGAGPPTAPASAPSSPSTSGDEASDTEGEMHVNQLYPTAAAANYDDRYAPYFGHGLGSSPPSAHSLPELQEYEEAAEGSVAKGEEDGGGANTPQSANSVASYGFDCTTSNSNAHSTAESCGKSPGIFSLEEDQLTDEAKDPSLIKELTLPSAATAQPEDPLGGPVDLLPLVHQEESQTGLEDECYTLGGKMAASDQGEVDPLEAGHHLGALCADTDSQPPYYSAICDKTDSFLAGDAKRGAHDDDNSDADDIVWSDEYQNRQTHSREDNQSQNRLAAAPVAKQHYLASVPGNRRPIDATLAARFATNASPPPPSPPATEADDSRLGGGGKTLERHQEHSRQQEVEGWLEMEEERLRAQRQRQLLELQRRELQQLQREQLMRPSPTAVTLSPSSVLCTIYEAMETSDDDDDDDEEEKEEEEEVNERRQNRNAGKGTETPEVGKLRPVPPQDLDWNNTVNMVQQLINQTLLLSGDGECLPSLLLPVGTRGTLSPLESSRWPSLLPQSSPPSATVTWVSSYSPDSQGSSPAGDWTVVEVETQH